jgi:Cu-Zn family superoxide dismutase
MLRVALVLGVCVLFSACDRRESVRGDGGRTGDVARNDGANTGSNPSGTRNDASGTPQGTAPGMPQNTPQGMQGMPQGTGAETPNAATVTLQGVNNASVQGTARLTQEDDGVRVVATVTGATPGKHGIHIHEKPDCSNPVAKSMGEHFSPGGKPHALPKEEDVDKRHLGDLGSIDIGQDGRGTLDIVVDGASLTSDQSRSFLNRALIVHAGEDKGREAQPAGNSGDPIACGVIKAGASG